MSAATQSILTDERPGTVLARPCAAAVILYAGILGAVDANGRAVPASDTAGLKVLGRVESDCDNSSGAAGDLTAAIKRGVFKFANSQANPVLAAGVDKDCYVEDDQTVAATSTNKVKAGRVVAVDSDGVWVDTLQASRVPTALALTSAQVATTAAVDLATAEALANALKTQGNAIQTDLAALVAALKAQGILV